MAAKKKNRTQKAKKTVSKKKIARKKKSPMKNASPKKSARKSAAPKKKSSGRKAPQKKAAARVKPAAQRTRSVVDDEERLTARPSRQGPGARSAGQSGDLQGLSRSRGADSESVDELLEEGNAFEADAVAGVESADDADEREVRTHEVPEDDVPEEYLDDER